MLFVSASSKQVFYNLHKCFNFALLKRKGGVCEVLIRPVRGSFRGEAVIPNGVSGIFYAV